MAMPTFKKREEIPSGFEGEYEEKDGEWVPKELTELKHALDRQKADAKAAKEAQRAAEQRAAELDTASKAKASGITDEQLKKVRDEVRLELAAEYAPITLALDTERAKVRTLQLDGTVKKLMLDAGVNPKRVDALFTLTGNRFDLNADGSPVLKDKVGTDLRKYLGETVSAEYPELYLSKQKGGVQFTGGAGGTVTEDMSKLLTSNPGALIGLANERSAA